MKQEDKELLFKDLCARIPYSVKLNIINRDPKNRIVELTEDNICHLANDWWSECKPYLFPMSSMTEEQKEEHKDLLDNQYSFDANGNIFTVQDFYCKYHLDFRGLIPMGLAIDCTNLNIY